MSDRVVPNDVVVTEAASRRLRELARRDAEPVTPVGAAALRSIDDESARLTYDSDADPAALAGLRFAAPSNRLLSFASADTTLEVDVILSRPRELFCQLMPARPSRLEILSPSDVVASLEDEFGTFHVVSVATGLIRLTCGLLRPPVSRLATTWLRI